MLELVKKQYSKLRLNPGTMILIALVGYFIIFPIFMVGFSENGVMGGIGALILAVPIIGILFLLALVGGESWVGTVSGIALIFIALMCLQISGPVLVNGFSRLFFDELWMRTPDVF